MKNLVILLLVVILSCNFIVSEILGESGYCVEAIVTDISPTSITVGDDFTVGILIDSCGDQAVKNIAFELINRLCV